MKKTVVQVAGAGNSGKTSAIHRFLAMKGLKFKPKNKVSDPETYKDVTLIAPMRFKNQLCYVGVATGGDTLGVVKRNLKFFDTHKVDLIVCASKSDGATDERINAYTRKFSVKPIQLKTRRVSGKSEQRADQIRVARAIIRALRDAVKNA